MVKKSNLTKTLWSKSGYYKKIRSLDKLDHPALKEIFSLTSSAGSVLDVGCGDGTKLSLMGNPSSKKYGLEVSPETVKLAKMAHPDFSFTVGVGESLPYPDNFFEVVTCLFVLEHTANPEKVILEIIRVTKPQGHFFLLAPNFGSPNRASPNFAGSRLQKLLIGITNDFLPGSSLTWEKVTPKVATLADFTSDLDTTVEPYLGSLLKFLRRFPIKVKKSSSSWPMELPKVGQLQRLFRTLGETGLYPFNNWGPHLYLIGQKT